MMRRWIAAASWALVACAAFTLHHPTTAAAPAAAAAATAVTCVDVDSAPRGDGIAIRLHNTCEFAVRCEVAWSVRCDGDDAEVTRERKRHAFDLAPSAGRQLLAAGDACGDAIWEITDESWECAQKRR